MIWVAEAAPITSMVFHIEKGMEQLIVTQDNGVFSWRTDVGVGDALLMFGPLVEPRLCVCRSCRMMRSPAPSSNAPRRHECAASVARLFRQHTTAEMSHPLLLTGASGDCGACIAGGPSRCRRRRATCSRGHSNGLVCTFNGAGPLLAVCPRLCGGT